MTYLELCWWKTNVKIRIKLLKRNVAFSCVHTAEIFADDAKVGYLLHTLSIPLKALDSWTAEPANRGAVVAVDDVGPPGWRRMH
jgi:hypothetical protein